MKTVFALIALAAGALAQKAEHLQWTLTPPAAAAPGATVSARLDAKIEPGWHLYSFSTPAAVPTSFTLAPNAVVEAVQAFQPKPHRTFDPNFNSDTETYEGGVSFYLRMRVAGNAAAGPAQLQGLLRYQTCNERMCVPGKRTIEFALNVDPGAKAEAAAIPAGYSEPKPPAAAPAADTEALGPFLLVAFGLGLAAIFTPCVFPMIPITMSFFLNRPSGSRRDGIIQAAIFCLGIVVLFSGLGSAMTAILGPFGVVQLGSNVWVNTFIALVFLAFGLSLLGAFEITIPSGILTRLDSVSQKGGTLGTLVMGLTFSLSAFACVGPFVGTLLAASVQSGGTRPLLGMVSFALGLALPFFGLALFPQYLKRLPRSGGWLARVKVVMGFVVLAAMLYKLSAVDQVLQWGFLTRERFLAAWIVLFAMAGLYLLGYVRLEGINKDDRMGLGRLLAGMAFVIFAISLLPGMFGARLGELDAYVPVGSSTLSPGGGQTALVWMKNQYREALDRARREGKLVFVNFTGYACTNCHWMKANMFPRPEIAAALKNFVLVELYTDGTDEASRLNQDLQEKKFGTVAIPYYAILDPNENVVASFPGLTKEPGEYLAFLEKGNVAPKSAATAAAGSHPLAEVSLTGLDGAAFDSARLAGKVVVVNFWATWCVPCIQEIPGFNRMNREYSDKGVVVLGVSMDEDGAPFGEAVSPQVSDGLCRRPGVREGQGEIRRRPTARHFGFRPHGKTVEAFRRLHARNIADRSRAIRAGCVDSAAGMGCEMNAETANDWQF